LLLLALTAATSGIGQTQEEGEISLRRPDKKRQEIVTYTYYIPKTNRSSPLPVLVCLGGLNSQGGRYMGSDWKEFARENGFAILSPVFKFSVVSEIENFNKRTSYHYPEAWSGETLITILKKIAKTENISSKKLYLFGHSAGAQFVHRFALLYPERCKAVAAHNAGSYDLPQRKINTKFLIAVGENDTTPISRVDLARKFVNACRKKRIKVELEIIPGAGHSLTQEQINLSHQFFLKARRRRR